MHTMLDPTSAHTHATQLSMHAANTQKQYEQKKGKLISKKHNREKVLQIIRH